MAGSDRTTLRPVGVVVLTRRAEDNAALKTLLETSGLRVLEAPALDIRLRNPDLDEAAALPEYLDAALFASRHGVKGFFAWRATQSHGIPDAPSQVGAVGPATAAEIERYGWPVTEVADPATGAQLAAQLGPKLSPKSRILAVRGSNSRDAASRALAEAGHLIYPLTVYENRAVPVPPIGESVDVAVFASPSAVTRYRRHNPNPPRVGVVAIGTTTAEALRQIGWTPTLARATDTEALGEAVRQLLHRTPK